MPWFAVPVVFSIAAPTSDAAVLLAEDQHAGELVELLDYPDVSVSALGEDLGEQPGDGPLVRYLVVVTTILEADGAPAARSFVESSVAELDASTHDFRKIRDPEPTSDPRLLARATKRVIEWANDVLGDHLQGDAAALRAGDKFEDLIVLDQVLPSCFAAHYDADLVDRFTEVVNGVANKLSSYPDTYLATTAEELAAHALIDEAEAVLEIQTEESAVAAQGEDGFTHAEAAVARRELAVLHEEAFEDHDVLMLFDPRLDGIENAAVAEMMGFANLHVHDWFRPFRRDRE